MKLIGLAFAMGIVFGDSSDSDDLSVRVVFDRRDGYAIVEAASDGDAADEDSLRVEIRSASGIGKAVLERTAEAWPTRLLLCFPLRGLEQLNVTIGEQVHRGFVSTQTGTTYWSIAQGTGAAKEIAPSHPAWSEISIRHSNQPAETPIPIGEGAWFELEIPRIWLESNPQTIELAWVDFFR